MSSRFLGRCLLPTALSCWISALSGCNSPNPSQPAPTTGGSTPQQGGKGAGGEAAEGSLAGRGGAFLTGGDAGKGLGGTTVGSGGAFGGASSAMGGSAMAGTAGVAAASGGAGGVAGSLSGRGGTSTTGGSATGGSAGVGGTSANIGGGSGGNAGAETGGHASGGGGAVGLGGTAGASSGGTGGNSHFTLAWQDDFNSLDASAWQLQSFSFDGNEAQFTPQNASVADGLLTISLTRAPAGSAKPYLGVEMRSIKTLTYGKVSASMRFAGGAGVVSGLVLFYTPYPNCNWNEIDIEHLGNSSSTSQLNCQVYLGTPASTCTASVTPTQDPMVVNLGANAETAFHQYDIEWTPSEVRFYIDGTLLRTWTAHVSQMTLPQTILLTIWASSAASWAGALTPTSAPTSAQVDWIKVYDWKD